MEATTLDIAKAYRNSPIVPAHKPYLPIMWDVKIYMQHIDIESLATAAGIQGSVADACIKLLKHEGIHPMIKWVDDFVFFQSPTTSMSNPPTYTYNLHSIQALPHLSASHCTLSHAKAKTSKPTSPMSDSNGIFPLALFPYQKVASLLSSLQHLTFVYRAGHHFLPAIGLFMSKFPNKFV